ncbi:PREDICTED: uncharacterized protein LOC109461922 [Branchiostoma belcheri]|uniref:Uncharacterized protein LOC109461922 n=1 Tax=Branchiostoma belcheri TaxID=7741 RepID=A0A6P4YAW5_BRABE|nr:PREDICTED: uncharacterized protein LOC109461922 [Branchiostoma belcheri]
MRKILVLLCVIGLALAGPIPEAREDNGSGYETPETVYPDEEEKPENDGYDVTQPEKSDTESDWPFEDPWTFDTDWEIPGWDEVDPYDPDQPDSERPISNYPEEAGPEEKDLSYPEQAEVQERDPDPYYPDPEESNREDPGFYYPEQPDQEEPEPEYPEREGYKEDHGGNQAAEQQQPRQEGAETMPVEEAAQYRQPAQDIVAGGSRPGQRSRLPPDLPAAHPATYHPSQPAPDPGSDDYPDYTDTDVLVYYTYHSVDTSRLHPYQNVPQHYNNAAYARAGYSPYDPRNYWIQHTDGSYSVNPYYHDYSDDRPSYL